MNSETSVDMVSEERDDVDEIKRIGDNRDSKYAGLSARDLHNGNNMSRGVKKDLFYAN